MKDSEAQMVVEVNLWLGVVLQKHAFVACCALPRAPDDSNPEHSRNVGFFNVPYSGHISCKD